MAQGERTWIRWYVVWKCTRVPLSTDRDAHQKIEKKSLQIAPRHHPYLTHRRFTRVDGGGVALAIVELNLCVECGSEAVTYLLHPFHNQILSRVVRTVC